MNLSFYFQMFYYAPLFKLKLIFSSKDILLYQPYVLHAY